MPKFDSEALLIWFQNRARDLPWRGTHDPYAIWVSEVMLQQTRVDTVIPYYHRWLDLFPTVEALAAADEDDVLQAWEGLGYYRRARNLHRAARLLTAQHQSLLPEDRKSLQALPGIGSYTAGALASIAFNQDETAVDGNIRRVLTRFYDIDTPVGTAQTENKVAQFAAQNLVPGKAGAYNQALMELGALVCTPQNPDCASCPLADGCLAKKAGVQELRPVRKKKKPTPHIQVTAAVFRDRGRVLLAKRPPEGMLGGMWEFPGGKQEDKESLEEALIREIGEELGVKIEVIAKLGSYPHAYSHFSLTLHAFFCKLISREISLTSHTDWAWVALPDLTSYPLGKVDRQIADQLQAEYKT